MKKSFFALTTVIFGVICFVFGLIAIASFVSKDIGTGIFVLIIASPFGIICWKAYKKYKISSIDNNELLADEKLNENVSSTYTPIAHSNPIKPKVLYTPKSDVELCLEDARYLPIEPEYEPVNRNNEMDNPIRDYKNITKATKLDLFREFIAIDTETTGLKPGGNDIIEIAAVRFKDFKAVEVYHSYCKPRKSIPKAAQDVNHITDDMVMDKPSFQQLVPQLQDFICDSILVAHNAPFDVKFLHCGGLDLSNHNTKFYDTLQLSRFKFKADDYDDGPYSYKLSDICDYVGIEADEFHGALTDATCCGLLFIEILEKVFDECLT